MALEEDLDLYFEIRTDLVERALNQFVLIHNSELVGVYPTLDQALADASSKFDPGTFLIKQVLDPEPVETV